jgi:GNAT superfamily N-acetyltransferase
MNIRNMRATDLDFAAGCTATEGWRTETRSEFEGVLEYDSAGAFVAERAGKRIGICAAVSYGRHGFVGELIVLPDERGKGVGGSLMRNALDYLAARGAESVLLDAVPAAAPLYERMGFRHICASLRFAAPAQTIMRPHEDPARTPQPAAHHVRLMRAEDLPAVCALDRDAFGADRSFFLTRRLRLYPDLCLILETRDHLDGFIQGRRGLSVISAGPWIMRRPEESADPRTLRAPETPAGALLTAWMDRARTAGWGFALGVLASNPAAAQAARQAGFAERPSSSLRMVRGKDASLGASHLAYAIGSAAKG